LTTKKRRCKFAAILKDLMPSAWSLAEYSSKVISCAPPHPWLARPMQNYAFREVHVFAEAFSFIAAGL
jgi:hypothetical protein